MKHAADYSLAGNPEGYANFLTHNQKGVVRLIQAGKTGAPDRPDDMYWKKDVDSMNSTFTKCSALLTELAAGNDRIAEQAKSLQPKFAALVDEVKNQGNLSTDATINLAKRFFTVAAQIYTLKAMKG